MLRNYIIAVIVVWIVILICVKLFASSERFMTMLIFCAGFLIGMFAMWIAMHVYKN